MVHHIGHVQSRARDRLAIHGDTRATRRRRTCQQPGDAATAARHATAPPTHAAAVAVAVAPS